MTDKAKEIKEKLNTARVDSTTLNKILKDRIDFGFDSIYFRYSELVEELSWHKEIEARRQNEHFNRGAWCTSKRMHFYECLEQFVHAHQDQEVKGNGSNK